MSEQLQVPEHISIIMDGNGRWAEAQGKMRFEGHIAGFDNIERIGLFALDQGVQVLSVYTLSIDNINKRPSEEIDILLRLFLENVEYAKSRFNEENVRVRFVGNASCFPRNLQEEVCQKIREIEESTRNNTRGTFVVASAYEGRDEIRRAARNYASESIERILEKIKNDGLAEAQVEEFTQEILSSHDIGTYMDAPDLPDVDLIIRTSGEYRCSSFLMWYAPYAEFYVTERYWPDFSEEDFMKALEWYGTRERRFGGIG